MDKKIGIIGGGNMGEAIFSGLARVMEKSTALMMSELDAARREALQARHKIIVEIDNNYLVKYCDVIVLAVKPQDLDTVLTREVCCGVAPEKLLISVAAGVTTAHIEKIVGAAIPVIRAMPNMAAVIGQAVSSLSPGSAAKANHMETAKFIFSAIGEVITVDEKLVDAVTAVSGSGPAYFFYFIEALIEAGEKLGLDSKTAEKLALRTAVGSAKLLESLGVEPSELRRRVTSKGGTTEAAIRVFDGAKLRAIVAEAAAAARKRSQELSGR